MMGINVEYPVCYQRWTVEGLSDSRPSPERDAFWCANESSALVNGVNAGILSLRKIEIVKTVYLFLPRSKVEIERQQRADASLKRCA